jgi:hypothetical protein
VEVLAMTRVLAAAGVATVLAFGSPAQAESRFGIHIVVASGHGDRYDDRYARPRYDDYGQNAYHVGYSRGYEEGFDEGKDDAEDRDRFDYWDDKDYRHADKGYRDHYGPRWDYERGFRSGFEEGYRRAYAHFERRHDHGRCDTRYYTREIPRYRYSR